MAIRSVKRSDPTRAIAARRRGAAVRSTARVFWSGRSQAVRLPKEFRIASPLVHIYREGDRIVLEPPAAVLDACGWPRGFWDDLGVLDADFNVGERNPPHERPDPLGDDA
jgi:antitoxin VapB